MGKFCDLLKRDAFVVGISEVLLAFLPLRPAIQFSSAIGTAGGVCLQNLPQVIFVTATHVVMLRAPTGIGSVLEFTSPVPLRTMTQIKIDTSQVPRAKLHDPRFLTLLTDMRMRLADPKERRAMCIHEVTHAMYLTKAGKRNLKVTGPQIEYNAKSDTYDRTGASVNGDVDQQYLARVSVAEWISAMAKAYAAPAVAVEVLASRRGADNGDAGDRQGFEEFLKMVRTKHPDIRIDFDSLWTKSRKSVRADLQKPKWREAILKSAEELEAWLFPRN